MKFDERLARIEAKLEDIAKDMDEHRRESKQNSEKMSSRVSDIEKKINYAAGALASLGLFFGVAITYIKERFFS